jgi:hypothetical protein
MRREHFGEPVEKGALGRRLAGQRARAEPGQGVGPAAANGRSQRLDLTAPLRRPKRPGVGDRVGGAGQEVGEAERPPQ